MKYIIPLLIVLTVFTGCDKKQTVSEVPTTTQEVTETSIAVATSPLSYGNIENYIDLNGNLIAKNASDIVAENTGKITECYVEYGDTVEKGQTIALIDPSKPGMKYEKTPLIAPSTGTITELYFKQGSYVAPGASLGKVTDTKELRLSVYIPEQYVSKVYKDQEVSLSLDSYKGETFSGKITFLDPIIDKQARTRNAEIQIRTDSPLIIGMHSRAKLLVEKHENVLLISKTSLIEENGQKYVYIVENNRAKRVEVTTGLYDDTQIEITSGLTGSETLIVKGLQLLSDGTKVSL